MHCLLFFSGNPPTRSQKSRFVFYVQHRRRDRENHGETPPIFVRAFFSHCGSRGQTVKKVEDAFEGRQVEGGAADAGAVPCPQRSGGARAPSLLAGKGRYSTRTKTHPRFSTTSSTTSTTIYWGGRCVLSHHRARPHMHTLTSPSLHGPAAPAAVDIFAFALLRVQVLVGDDYPPGASCSSLFAVSVRAGCSR